MTSNKILRIFRSKTFNSIEAVTFKRVQLLKFFFLNPVNDVYLC